MQVIAWHVDDLSWAVTYSMISDSQRVVGMLVVKREMLSVGPCVPFGSS